MASGISLSGYVVSMTGVIFPDSMSSLRTINCSWSLSRLELTNAVGIHQPVENPLGAPICGRYQLNADFFDRLVVSPKFVGVVCSVCAPKECSVGK